MKTLSAIIVMALVSCGQPSTTDSSKGIDTTLSKKTSFSDRVDSIKQRSGYDSSIYKRYINTQLIAFLNKEYAGWTLPTPNRWDTIWFNQYKTDSSLVNYISGDFDCNGNKDYALIFINHKNIISAYAFLSTENSFKAFKLEEFGEDSGEQIEAGMEILKPGEYNYIDPGNNDNPQPAVIKCNAVQVSIFEKVAETFYWDKGMVKSITTGD